MAEAVAAESHPHETAVPADHHGSHHGAQSNSPHDHAQCDHDQLLALFTSSQTSQFFDLLSRAFQFQQEPLFVKGEFTTLTIASPSPALEHGPPGAALSSTPLYLEISVLRI